MINFTYVAGDNRCNFVSKHSSSWKTTLFTKDKENAESVLQVVLKVLGEEYKSSSVTHTTPRTKEGVVLSTTSGDQRRRFANQNLASRNAIK